MATSTLASARKPDFYAPAELRVAASRGAYRAKTSFVAVHFDQAGKGRIDLLPKGAELRVIGPSSCLREGCEVLFERRIYNVFEIDLATRCIPTLMPTRAKGHTLAVCA